MMKYVLDTTAFSAIMGHDPDIMNLLLEYKPGYIATVPPVVAEIYYGIERLNKSSKKYLLLKAEKDRILSAINILPWSPEASFYFGKIKANLEKNGNIIDDLDITIAAIALAHKYGVITSNLKHFRRVIDLECRGWEEGL